MKKKEIEFKVLRKNSYGHRFILEPKERIKFRKGCKYNKLGTMCEKGYECYIDGGVLLGCTPDVSCPRCHAWDKRHGLELPYTMVENEYPDLKPTTFTWHPATESPGKRCVLMAMTRKDLGKGQYVFQSVQFCSPDVRPATVAFRDDKGRKQLPVAWAFYDEIIKGVAPWMISGAEFAAWGWWPEKEETTNKK